MLVQPQAEGFKMLLIAELGVQFANIYLSVEMKVASA